MKRDCKGRFVRGFRYSKETEFKKGSGGPKSLNWKGGRRKTSGGYILIYAPNHHKANPEKSNGLYVYEHVVVAENKYQRHVEKGEVVHHLNGIKDDNRPENLVIVRHRDHSSFHNKDREKSNRKYLRVSSLREKEPRRGLFITTRKNGKIHTYESRECMYCKELFWTRKDGVSKACSQPCAKRLKYD